jgi:tetratricopeptide (TPR) repeat protein
MYRLRLLTASIVALLLCNAATSQAIDTIRVGKVGVLGTLKDVDRYEIVVKERDNDRKISVGEIESVQLEGEPRELAKARSELKNGQLEAANKSLQGVAVDNGARPEVRAELQFLRALAATRLALAGGGEVNDAGRMLMAFIRENPKSFHSVEAHELMAELLLANKKAASADRYFAEVGKAPWPEAKLRGAVGQGRALQAQSKFEPAREAFERALAIEGDTPAAVALRLEATLGKAVCLAQSGKPEDGVKLIEEVLAKAPAEDDLLHAKAYNRLGDCYQLAKAPREAVLAYLHVDLVYFQNPDAHAEALANLSKLWKDLNRADRATAAANLLKQRYPQSHWAKAG